MANLNNTVVRGILDLQGTTQITANEKTVNAYKYDAASGNNIYGDNSKITTLNGARLVLNNAMYGTGNPSASGAKVGQIYFKII